MKGNCTASGFLQFARQIVEILQKFRGKPGIHRHVLRAVLSGVTCSYPLQASMIWNLVVSTLQRQPTLSASSETDHMELNWAKNVNAYIDKQEYIFW